MLLRIPYVYDFDDAWHLRYCQKGFGPLRIVFASKIEETIRNATFVFAGNRYLSDYAKNFNKNTRLVPSSVDIQKLFPIDKPRVRPFTIGWIGTFSTDKYLQNIIKPLASFASEFRCRFVVIGGRAPSIENVEVVEISWSEDNELDTINSLDVGVMPLTKDEWSKGKCAFKLVQYMACGLPVIASRVGANIDLVTEECGILVDNDDEWLEALKWMHRNPVRRAVMGECGRRRVQEKYSLQHNLPKIFEVVTSSVNREALNRAPKVNKTNLR